MKNINKLLNIILLAYMLSGCRKTDDLQLVNTNISESLSRDSSFKLIVQLELALKDKITVEQINTSSMNDPNLLNYLTKFNSDYYKAWNNLKNRYGKIKEQDVKDASKSYFEQQKLFAVGENKIRSNSIKPNAKNQCTWGYDLCIAGVTAGAILCHAGCIGGTAGFGAPACVLLCGTMQVAAGAQCMKGYCDFSN
ncbi:MAG: hypothetical protein RL387_1393 [Bacteroidota bacterium]|jgi:hypothetical protein